MRINIGWTRQDLATAAGMHLRTVGRIEAGSHTNPDWNGIVKLIEAMGMKLHATFRDTNGD